MRIAVLGAGNIGRTLGVKWSDAGHAVTYGARNPDSPKAQAARASVPDAPLVSISQALADSEVVLFSTPHAAVGEIARQNAAALTGKIVFDATNDFGSAVVNNVHTILDAAPTARVYRAFNSLGWEVFADPRLAGLEADLVYCGPDDEARTVVESLIAAIGVRPIWLGGYETLGTVDALGTLWVTLAFRRGKGRRIALKILGM